MRERHLEGQVIANEEIISLSRTGPVDTNMSWNDERKDHFDRQREYHIGNWCDVLSRTVDQLPWKEDEKLRDHVPCVETSPAKDTNVSNGVRRFSAKTIRM